MNNPNCPTCRGLGAVNRPLDGIIIKCPDCYPIEENTSIKVTEIKINIPMTIEKIERILIEETLRHCNGNKERTAKMLDVGLTTLYRKIREYRNE